MKNEIGLSVIGALLGFVIVNALSGGSKPRRKSPLIKTSRGVLVIMPMAKA